MIAKGDIGIFGGNLSVTFSRMRPTTVNPSVYTGNSDDQTFLNHQDRVAAQYVLSRRSWISETRFGWNRTGLDREQAFWFQTNPANSSEPPLTTVGDRIGLFSVSGLFTTPSSEVLDLHGRSYSAEQKLSRIIGVHNLKMGVNGGLQGGDKTNPQNTNYVYQTGSDLLSDIPSTVTLLPGVPPHDGYPQESGAFIQDDWRVNKRLVFNLGLRADFYPTIQVHATTNARRRSTI